MVDGGYISKYEGFLDVNNMPLYDLHLNLHLKIHNLPKTLILADLDRDQ